MAPGYNIVTWVKVPVPCASGRMTLNFSSYGCLAPPKSQSWTQWSSRLGALIRNKTHTCNMPLMVEVRCRGCSFQYQARKKDTVSYGTCRLPEHLWPTPICHYDIHTLPEVKRNCNFSSTGFLNFSFLGLQRVGDGIKIDLCFSQTLRFTASECKWWRA